MNPLLCHWLFADLSDAERASLAPLALRRHVADGQVLFRPGDPTPGLHMVAAGAVKIYVVTAAGEERIVEIVGPGEFCGEMGVVDRAPSAAWGEALGPADLWVIPARTFEEALLTHPSIGLKVSRVLVAKLRLASRQLDEALFLSARERVLRHLVRLADRHGRREPEGLRLPLRLTHQEVARVAGTARETVSRVLAELQEQRLLRFVERQMLFPDPEALRRMAGGEAEIGRPTGERSVTTPT